METNLEQTISKGNDKKSVVKDFFNFFNLTSIELCAMMIEYPLLTLPIAVVIGNYPSIYHGNSYEGLAYGVLPQAITYVGGRMCELLGPRKLREAIKQCKVGEPELEAFTRGVKRGLFLYRK
ncbi:hypothetical protein HZA97_04775 [Candidatus Woesearchaeota archaeon]|nr:hypothetical protein [Candidatus Woesearchaeota archaeon]